MSDPRTIVVGAGPVGLTAALALRAEGIPVVVVEAGAQDRIRPGSRAIFIHGASLRLLEEIRPGLGYALNEHGLIWLTKRTLYRGEELYARSYPAPKGDALPAATSLPQVITEQVLYEAAVEAGVEFVWETPVAGVEPSNDGVVVVAEDGRRLDATYAIGADGARSSVRSSLEIPLEGPGPRTPSSSSTPPRTRTLRCPSNGSFTTSTRRWTAATSCSCRSPATGASICSAGPTTTRMPSAASTASRAGCRASWTPSTPNG